MERIRKAAKAAISDLGAFVADAVSSFLDLPMLLQADQRLVSKCHCALRDRRRRKAAPS